MRGVLAVVLGLVTSACGGKLEAADTQTPASRDASAATDAPASTGIDAGVTIDDASTGDTSDAIGCTPTANDLSGCSGKYYCVAWVLTDDAASTEGYPEDGVVRSACVFGQLDEACGGKPPVRLGYNPYTNAVAWAVCVGP
jgi:hypothetical protein